MIITQDCIMDIERLKLLGGMITESDNQIPTIKGYGSNHFYLVYDIRPDSKVKRSEVLLGDVIARVTIGSAVDICNGAGEGVRHLNPELYPESEKDKAIADARKRILKVKE